MSLPELKALEDAACPGPGACGGQFTANTMANTLSVFGLSPMGVNDIPAADPTKKDAAYAVGQAVMKAYELGISAAQLLTRPALEKCSRCGRHRGVDKCGAPPAGHRLRG